MSHGLLSGKRICWLVLFMLSDIAAILLNGCNEADKISGDDVPGYSPVMVSADNDSPSTRGILPQGMYDNFKVFAASEKGEAQTVEMDRYEVRFVADNWSYVNDNQKLVYWDPNADSYLFTAGAPIDAVKSISATSMELSLENNTTGSVMAAKPLKIMNGSDDFGKRVNLRFAYAHCRVCVAFKKEGTEDMKISDIKLTPDAAIASKATLTYSYDWSTDTDTPTATSQVNTTEKSADAFSFADVNIPANNTTDAVTSATYYYCVPDANNTNQWQVSLKCNGETKQASFVDTETWQSGKNYIYVFSISEKGPKLIKVISQDNYFDCNDIESGGEFSNKDMTE